MAACNFSLKNLTFFIPKRMPMRQSRIFFIAFLLISTAVLPSETSCQLLKPNVSRIYNSGGRLPSNYVSDILISGGDIWFGTGGGLSLSEDGGLTFTNFSGRSGMGKGAASSLTYYEGVIWVATGYDTLISGDHLDAGGGLSWSDDKGLTWHHIAQPVDPNNADSLGYNPTTTHVQNITYDMAFHNDVLWIASWGGGLRKSEDYGQTWTVVTPDGLPFDALGNYNHTPFSIVSDADALWVGTAFGINKSTDGGNTWTNYNAQNSGISGNFVNGMGKQVVPGGTIIWASTWMGDGENEFYGVSRTLNGGLTWESMLEGTKPFNFGFNGDEVYVAAENGFYKSSDGGNHWGKFPWITDTKGNRIFTEEFYTAAYGLNMLWVGSADGLAVSADGGMTWDIKRAYAEPGGGGEPDVYAYPNPFSPSRHNRLGDEGHVRFQYSVKSGGDVSLDIYDYGMNLVRNVVSGLPRTAGSFAETWDGTNNWGRMVANGVYFYRLKVSGEGEYWGKIIILN